MQIHLQVMLTALKGNKIRQGPYKHFFVEIKKIFLGLVNLMNFIF